MTVPTPPVDASGGYFIIKVSGGGQVHRMRFHVNPFTNDNLGTYNTIPTGAETNVQASAANVMTALKGFFNNTWTLSLDAVFRNVGGVITQYFGVTPPAAVAGTSATAAGAVEEYVAVNFRTQGGHRGRFFLFGYAGWTYTVPNTIAAGNGTAAAIAVSYLTGGIPTGFTTSTQIVAHDGTALLSPARWVWGINKRLRRRAGDA